MSRFFLFLFLHALASSFPESQSHTSSPPSTPSYKLFEKLRLGENKTDTQHTLEGPQTLPATDKMALMRFHKPPSQELPHHHLMTLTRSSKRWRWDSYSMCKDGLVQEIAKLFSEMHEKDVNPEMVISTVVVEVFYKVLKFKDAIKVYLEMKKNGIVPNLYSYGLCKRRRLSDCEELLFEMKNAIRTKKN